LNFAQDNPVLQEKPTIFINKITILLYISNTTVAFLTKQLIDHSFLRIKYDTFFFCCGKKCKLQMMCFITLFEFEISCGLAREGV
jgi:hypothetical protein